MPYAAEFCRAPLQPPAFATFFAALAMIFMQPRCFDSYAPPPPMRTRRAAMLRQARHAILPLLPPQRR